METFTGFMYHMVHWLRVDHKGPRERLLDAAIQYVASNGIGDMSLRSLASALGTSHRMLIHHFGSKEKLWIEIAQTVEARQRELLAEMVPDVDEPIGVAMRIWWKHISHPALWANERLFFELYGQALQGRPHTAEFLDDIVENWLGPATELNVARGVPRSVARAHARAGVAITRGLLLDLLATGDVAGVDAAMDAFVDSYEAWGERAARLAQ
jgi:AcrR family transcriptional regulator